MQGDFSLCVAKERFYMINRLRRFYNQNREQLWFTVLVIVIIIAVVQILNNFAKQKNKININNNNYQNTVLSQSAKEQRIEESKQSVISDNKVEDKEYERESEIIERFVKFCNTGNKEQAYALLTDECKELLYPTVEDFTNNYINRNFSSYKAYSIQNYYNDTYKIRLTEDMLSTGKSNNGVAIQDYFTISGNKLNISEYLGRTQINSSGESNNIKIKVLYKDTFMDYEKYTIEVYNGNSQTIKLDSLEGTKSIYIENVNGIQYPSYSHELIESLLEIPQGNTRQLEVKFYNNYVSTNQIAKMVFSDIILDNNQYENIENKTQYRNRGTCTIGI